MISRRKLVASIATAATGFATRAPAAEAVLRIGAQKGEPVLMTARQNGSLEAALLPLGVGVRWVEFEFGPPILEAIRADAIDFGAVGDAPPIFAQAARSELVYVAAQRAGASAILLPPGSGVHTLADLKGRKVAFARASSAHNFVVATLEKAALTYADIEPLTLGPADAGAAFRAGQADAWAIWDPYAAIFQRQAGVRVLTYASDVFTPYSYFLAGRTYGQRNGTVLTQVIRTLGEVAAWSVAHRPEVARLLAAGTGVPLEAEQIAVDRDPFDVQPMTQEFVASQQVIADRFHRLGLIPRSIDVQEFVWRAAS